MSAMKRSTYEKETRKWYKWVCKKNLYEKSVRLTGTVGDSEFYTDLAKREVLMINWGPAKTKQITTGPFAGTEWPTTYFIDGYFRVRTDKGYYPRCGSSGIPCRRKSQAAMSFSKWLGEGWQKERAAKRQKEEKRMLERIRSAQEMVEKSLQSIRSIKSEREKARDLVSKVKKIKEEKRRMRISGKKGLAFFQMQAASQLISQYALTTQQRQ